MDALAASPVDSKNVPNFIVKNNTKLKFGTGWIPDHPDIRDFTTKSSKVAPLLKSSQYLNIPNLGIPNLTTEPNSIDLRVNCSPIRNQGSIGACHDRFTEVLTEYGWKLFKDIDNNTKIASVDPLTSKLIYENPSNVFEIQYDGDLYYSNRKNLDFAVTPDHKMLVRKWNEANRKLNNNYEFIHAKDLGWYSGLMCKIKHEGKKTEHFVIPGIKAQRILQRSDRYIDAATWMEFIGIFLAEGTLCCRYQSDQRPEKSIKYKIQIAAVKDRERKYVSDLLRRLGVKACVLKDRFTFSNKQICMALKNMGICVKSYNKFVPQFVFEQSPELIKKFLYGHFMGDGHDLNGSISHYTSSKLLADDLQRLVLLSGGWGILSVRPPRNSIMKCGRKISGKHNEHRVSRYKEQLLSIERKFDIQKKHYKGMVYCAEMPTYHTLITRRNGKMLISGNCTSFATLGVFEYFQKKTTDQFDVLSPLFLYWITRTTMALYHDSGATIRATVGALSMFGVCLEKNWAYTEDWVNEEPGPFQYAQAQNYKSLVYYRLDTVNKDKNTLLNDVKSNLIKGIPVIVGFTLYPSFYYAPISGIIPPVNVNEQPLGGHAISIVGFSDDKQHLIIRNSWGEGWGDKGYAYVPYSYVTSGIMADFWSIIKASWVATKDFTSDS